MNERFQTFYPKYNHEKNLENLENYKICGVIMGLALKHDFNLGLNFALPFYKIMCGE
jgi:hypothetical protein